MLRPRLIPSLLLHDGSIVKTTKFRSLRYIGDPANTCRIFNELCVDELALLDISATIDGRGPDLPLLKELASECFMPLSYGGGIDSVEVAGRVLELGFEKIIVNTAALRKPQLIEDIAVAFGSQSLVASVDVKRTRWRRQQTCWGASATVDARKKPLEWARRLEDLGAGEILLTRVEREGTWTGLDVGLVRSVTEALSIPVIAQGGAGNISHVREALDHGGASAVAVGSMVVFQKMGAGVLVNFPTDAGLRAVDF
ncbi:MAG TPA: HisA/HisF-related TIM barrel protein [Gemmatimonadaceae bacterium]|nr:HisA/HisF-related TIM barrel protein [Gemmatimonadaceae bacterium]